MAALSTQGGSAAPQHDEAGLTEESAAPAKVRPGCLLAGAMLVLGAVAVLAYLAVSGGGGGRIDLGRVTDYAPGSVVYRSTDGLFVVRLADEGLIALSDLDPHNPPGRRSCRVTFRPDLGGPDLGGTTPMDGVAGRSGDGTAEREGTGGRFFDACTGAVYDLAGRGLNGDGLDLRRLPLIPGDEGRLLVEPAR